MEVRTLISELSVGRLEKASCCRVTETRTQVHSMVADARVVTLGNRSHRLRRQDISTRSNGASRRSVAKAVTEKLRPDLASQDLS